MYRSQLAKPYLTDDNFDDRLVKEAYERMQLDINASHILVSVSNDAIPSDTLLAYNKALNIRKRIIDGLNFSQAAKQYSDDKSAIDNGGNLGYFSVFMMVYPFESAAYKTDINEVSSPIRTKYGYHLIKVNNKRKAVGEVKVAHIMFKLSKDASDEQINDNEKKAKEIYDQIKEGKSFSELAKQFSEDRATAIKGGILPRFGVGKMVKEFEDVSFSLNNTDNISKPFRTDFGWHIVKLIEKSSIVSFNDVKDELKKKVYQDSRNALRDIALISKIKKEYNFKSYIKNLEELLSYVDDRLVNGIWEINNNKSLNKKLFVLDGINYSQNNFINYITSNQAKVNLHYKVYFNDLYNSYINNVCLDYENSMLEEKHPEFKALLREYSDGILLFDLMDEMVWSKAIRDTIGLKKYFDNNNNYIWDERAVAKIYTCIDERVAKRTLYQVKRKNRYNKIDDNDILKKINYSSPLNLKIIEGKYIKGENTYLSSTEWKVGTSNLINDMDGSVIIVDILEILPRQRKQLSETRGKVISDYQDYLESSWVSELKKKYNVKVNTTVLYNLIQ
jgi:peptidyl-prolyl cis-trans isomerase SurA